MQGITEGRALRAGREALAHFRWEQARTRFEAVLVRGEAPEALEGLSLAQWCLGEADATLQSLERAYRLYKDRGEPRAAARVATELAVQNQLNRGETAVANGWLQRAHRLLDDLDPGPEHAVLAVWEAHLLLLYWNDPQRAQERLADGARLSRALRLTDIELLALGLEGVVLVHTGSITEGMKRLDEVTTAAVAGELKDVSAAGNACCYMLTACEQVSDYDRLAQWFERVRSLVDHWRYRPALTFCRNHMIALLLWRGSWKEAEAEIEAMIREAEDLAPSFVAEGRLRLGDLRRRQGRLDEAAELYARLETDPRATLGRAAIAFERGDAASAADLVDRFFRRLPPGERLERVPGLELLVRASLRLGRRGRAEAAMGELHTIAEAAATEALRAAVRAAEAALAADAGDHETARRHLEDAIDLYTRSGGPHQAARARLDLACSLIALGRGPAAEAEAHTALDAAERLGAAGEAERARSLVREASAPPRATAGSGADRLHGGLSRRELEVLSLVAQGLSNQDIATRLYLSEHTAKRHVANILSKLGLPSRAAAAAYATRIGAI